MLFGISPWVAVGLPLPSQHLCAGRMWLLIGNVNVITHWECECDYSLGQFSTETSAGDRKSSVTPSADFVYLQIFTAKLGKACDKHTRVRSEERLEQIKSMAATGKTWWWSDRPHSLHNHPHTTPHTPTTHHTHTHREGERASAVLRCAKLRPLGKVV